MSLHVQLEPLDIKRAQFIELYPPTIDPSTAADLSLRKVFCDFLRASLLIVLAREEENVADQVCRLNLMKYTGSQGWPSYKAT